MAYMQNPNQLTGQNTTNTLGGGTMTGNFSTITGGQTWYNGSNSQSYQEFAPTKCDYDKCPTIVESLRFVNSEKKNMHIECLVSHKVEQSIDKLLHEKSGLARWLEEHRK